jgi:hypothetical protein
MRQQEELGVIVQNVTIKDTLEFPELNRGSCVHIYLNNQLKLESYDQTYWKMQ